MAVATSAKPPRELNRMKEHQIQIIKVSVSRAIATLAFANVDCLLSIAWANLVFRFMSRFLDSIALASFDVRATRFISRATTPSLVSFPFMLPPLQDMSQWAADNLLKMALDPKKNWQPQDLLPDPESPDFEEQVWTHGCPITLRPGIPLQKNIGHQPPLIIHAHS